MILQQTIDRVRYITLDRPERRNALGTDLMRQLRNALVEADADAGIGAVLLTGAPPAFCAGSDLKELAGLSGREMADHEAATAAVARSIADLRKPVLAAVEGYALGGGFILAASCDMVVTADNASWHLPEVTNGWLPPWGLLALLARVGPVKARLLTWGPVAIDGAEAYRLGVADALAPAGGALDVGATHAARLAALPPSATASCKRFFQPFTTAGAERADRRSLAFFVDDASSEAAQRTLERFQAK